MRPRTALLCWEAGGGIGHATTLLEIARRLAARGWRVVLALPGDRAPPIAAATGIGACAAPRWGEGLPQPAGLTGSSASMGDILAELGLQFADWTRRQIERWRLLFAQHEPDVVLADYAPGAVLAARGLIPCVACGVGFTVPPAGLPHFPPLHELAPIVYDEAAVCATVNAALAALGIRPLTSLVECLIGDAQCVCTLPLLDPYATWRREPVLGPLLTAAILRRAPGADEIFCYLREPPGQARLASLAPGLAVLPAPVAAHIPGLDRSAAERLRRGGVKLADRPLAIARQLARSRLAVHFGGHGTTAAALLAGVPQLILDFDIEKSLIAAPLAQRKAAVRLAYSQADADSLRAGVLAALDDPQLAANAEEIARAYDRYRYRDVAARVADVCARLLAQPVDV